ncbi:unnamed protein product, partial [Tetraodon nigroviridis]
LFVGGPRLLPGQPALLGHRAPPGRALPQRDQPALPAQTDLKRAIWNYIHCVIGIRYDDYDYGEVNQLLPRDLKLYIKGVACFPDATKTPACPLAAPERVGPPRAATPPPPRRPWPDFPFALPQTQVNLLIMEARLQGELLYALRAITKYM